MKPNNEAFNMSNQMTVTGAKPKYDERKKDSVWYGKVDVIIPAYKAHKTLIRTLSSIAMQNTISDIYVTIVNDACPEGDYQDYVKMFSPYFKIREIICDENKGPGVARQIGIDYGNAEFFTCIDADDTFASTIAIEALREHFKRDVPQGAPKDVIKCVSSVFLQMGDEPGQLLPHQRDMVWMFGKMYRREYIEKMKIRFNTTRANEDTGFNTIVRLLCSNPNEILIFAPETTYFWHPKKDSITRVNDGQYGYDQCQVGWTENMIYAARHARKIRPFAESIAQHAIFCMNRLYFTCLEIHERKPVFMDQIWQCAKQFYWQEYREYEKHITKEAFSEIHSMAATESWGSGNMIGIVPYIGIREFMDKLAEDPYNEDDWYDIWDKIPYDLRDNNVRCGVAPAFYWVKDPNKKKGETDEEAASGSNSESAPE